MRALGAVIAKAAFLPDVAPSTSLPVLAFAALVAARRGGRATFLWLALAAAALALAWPSASVAGTYDVVACDAAPGGANNSWTAWVPGTHMRAQTACSGGAGLMVSNRPGAGAPSYGEQAWATFWAPAGAKVVAVTMAGGYWRPGAAEPGAEDYAAELVDADYGWYLDGCRGGTTNRCASWSSVPRTVTMQPTRGVGFVASCWGSRCRDGLIAPAAEFGTTSVAARMTSLSVRVSDDVAPTAVVDAPGGWIRGTHTVGYRASDGAGVRVSRLQVDGVAHGTETLTCDYTRAAPCPDSVERAFVLDTTSLSDGTHSLRVEALDPAANAGLSPARTIRIDNTAPTVSLSGAGSPDAPHPGPITVSLDGRDAASGMGGGEIVWKLDDSAWAHSAGDEASVRIDPEGEHRLTYYAVDAAGNRSPEQTRTIVIRRPLDPAPRSGGPGFAARSANPATTFTAASRFGEPCPASATITADRTAVLNARTLLVGFPLPAAPGCTVASATLRVYVTAHDGGPVQAVRASSSWSPADVTWDTRPGVVGAAASTAAQNGWVEWEVAPQVAGLYRHGDNGLYVTGAATDRPAQLVVRFAE